MRLKSFFLTCLLASVFFTTTAQDIKVDSSSAKTLRIDPQYARGATVSQLYDEVEFIPLETNKECLFGNISSLKLVKDNYVFYDYDTKGVYIFTNQGKFKAKINASKFQQDPTDKDKEKSEFWGFTVVKDGEQDLIKLQTSKYSFYFDLDGKQVKRVLKNDEKYTSSFRFSDGKTSIDRYFQKITGKDTIRYQMVFVRNNKDSVGYFPYKPNEVYPAGQRIHNSNSPDEYMYHNYNSYDLFKVTPDKISLAYRVVLPAAITFSKDIVSNPLFKKSSFEFLLNNKVVFDIDKIQFIGNQLYLKLDSHNWTQSTKKMFAYNLKTSEVTSLQDIEPDSLSHFLPVNDGGSFYDFINYGFQLYENGYLYTSYSSLAMFTFKEQSEGKKAKFPPVLDNYFKSSNKKSNPVIIKLKPKKI
ncbi:6-bladed beta-propeller [Pedobacter frigoris]|uniref:6-bladed beta-propeller n=1 Tax=Pedobacter frigoris TaxID=2571272 RepID=UPI00292E1421|nr:6-bladed beta-propeller [Pedobacter frigoris]